jgi:glutathione S-transferase
LGSVGVDIGIRHARLVDQFAVRANIARIQAIWEALLARYGGPMLFGKFSIADAYYAPVCMRPRAYALPVSHTGQTYVDRVTALPSVAEWISGALAEQWFVVEDEPYRPAR